MDAVEVFKASPIMRDMYGIAHIRLHAVNTISVGVTLQGLSEPNQPLVAHSEGQLYRNEQFLLNSLMVQGHLLLLVFLIRGRNPRYLLQYRRVTTGRAISDGAEAVDRSFGDQCDCTRLGFHKAFVAVEKYLKVTFKHV